MRRTPLGERWSRLGLRSRVTFAFAVGATVLSGTLAFTTSAVVQHYLLAQRTRGALNEAFTNARLIQQTLTPSDSGISSALANVTQAEGEHSLLFRHGSWFSASVTVGSENLPAALVQDVLHDHVATQIVRINRTPDLVVGIPIPSAGVDYFAVSSLGELQSTIDLLEVVVIVVALCTAAGGALVGRWASSRLTQPLKTVSAAAATIGGGDLTTRVPEPSDRDLAALARSFNTMVDNLEERIERDARFTSDVTHELRSPLTAVQASVALLSKYRAWLPGDGEKAVDLLEVETSRFSQSLEMLLELSRADAGGASFQPEEVLLVELVEKAIAVREGGAVPLEVACDADDVTAMCDKRRMRRVIDNLLDNAARHGGGATAVRLGVDGPWASISIEDAGPGVPPDERDRIFERFYRGRRTERRTDTPGAGLGLALVVEDMRIHGGSVEVDERPGGGARFTLRLPVGRP